jgi:hypothetical protein
MRPVPRWSHDIAEEIAEILRDRGRPGRGPGPRSRPHRARLHPRRGGGRTRRRPDRAPRADLRHRRPATGRSACGRRSVSQRALTATGPLTMHVRAGRGRRPFRASARDVGPRSGDAGQGGLTGRGRWRSSGNLSRGAPTRRQLGGHRSRPGNEVYVPAACCGNDWERTVPLAGSAPGGPFRVGRVGQRTPIEQWLNADDLLPIDHVRLVQTLTRHRRAARSDRAGSTTPELRKRS